MRVNSGFPLVFLGWVFTASAADSPSGSLVEYQGLCNASAAVALGGGHFIVADDEDKPKNLSPGLSHRTGRGPGGIVTRAE